MQEPVANAADANSLPLASSQQPPGAFRQQLPLLLTQDPWCCCEAVGAVTVVGRCMAVQQLVARAADTELLALT